MVPVSYPGVYVLEVASGVHTITGVATSIAAFFGRATTGPLNRAVHVLSMADFTRTFGKPNSLSDLAQSVKGFFDNGGNDCYVVRLAGAPVAAASVIMRNLAASARVLTATAKSAGTWGNGLRLEVDYNTPNPDDTFNLRVLQLDGVTTVAQEGFANLSMNPNSPRFAPAFVSQSSTLIDLALHADLGGAPPAPADPIFAASPSAYSQSRRPLDTTNLASLTAVLNPILLAGGNFQISVSGSAFIPITLASADIAAAVAVNDVATLIASAITSQMAATDPTLAVTGSWHAVDANNSVLRLTSNVAGVAPDNSNVTIRRATQNDLAGPLMLGLDQGGIEVARFSNARPALTGAVYVGGAAFGNFTDAIDTLSALAQNAINTITIDGTAVAVNLQTTGPARPWYESAGPGFDGVREKLGIIAQAITSNAVVGYRGEVWGYHLALIKTASGTVNDIATVASSGSALLGTGFIANVRRYSLGGGGTGAFQVSTAGTDGGAPLVADYLGDELAQTGFHALDTVDIFNLMVLPGDREVLPAMVRQIIGPAAVYCQQKRAFLLLDAPDSWTSGSGRLVAGSTEVNTLRSLIGSPTDHAAVFYPKLMYSDNGIVKQIGASGIIAGLISRIDATRGVWKAPAGVEAGLNAILDVQVNLTDKENGVLNKLGANSIRKFPSGIVCWGARTLAGSDDIGSEWKYIPIRRLALFLEESLYRGTQWVVFEPNDEPLWAKVRLNLNAFMMGLFRQGAFQGTTPDKAFYVKCDAETTTQNDRNLGIVNIEVGFAPLKPAEFVIIKIQQIAGDLN